MLQRKSFFVSALCLLLLVGFLTTSLVSYYVAKSSVATQLREQMLPLTSDNIYSEIQRDLLQPLLISSLMAHDTFVTNWVAEGEQDPSKISEFLEQIKNKYDTITAFFVSDKTLHYYHPKGILRTISPDDPSDAWYFHAREISAEYEINVDRDTAAPDRLSIFVNYRVLNEQGDLMGVTGVGLSVESVMALIEDYQARYGRRIYFVDRAGKVTMHGRDFSEAKNLKNKVGFEGYVETVLSEPNTSVIYTTPTGNEVYVNSRFVPEFNWYLMVEQVNDPAAKRIERALVINILISLVISGIVLLSAYFTLRGYQRRLEKMATEDKLTGAASRQIFDVIYDRAVKNSRRYNTPITLVSMDLDHFKSINDTYGHLCGDEVIRTISQIVFACTRDSDTLCRWGGEEFLLLLEDCNLERATAVAESIRVAIAAHVFSFEGDAVNITASFGVSERRPKEAFDLLIGRVDRALYTAKNKGRNQVCAVS